MDIHHIEYFLVLKKYEHMSIAADFLNISQPSLSKSITTLESELGVKLFDRVGRRIKLNENGENFAHYAEQAMQLLNVARLSAKSSCYETNGSISIYCYTFAPIILPCLREYTVLNPLVKISVSQGEHHAEQNPDFILRSSMDVAELTAKEQFWVAEPLFQEFFYLVTSPDYPALDWTKYSDEIPLEDCREANFITMIQSDIFFNDVTYELCQQAGFFPKIYSQTDDFLVKMRLVGMGQGVALIPESCLREAHLLVPDVRAFRMNDVKSERTVVLMRPKKNQMTETAQDFYDFVLDYFELPPDPRD